MDNKSKGGQFVQIPMGVIRECNLNAAELKVYCEIVSATNNFRFNGMSYRKGYISQGKIADRLGMKRQHVNRTIKSLVQKSVVYQGSAREIMENNKINPRQKAYLVQDHMTEGFVPMDLYAELLEYAKEEGVMDQVMDRLRANATDPLSAEWGEVTEEEQKALDRVFGRRVIVVNEDIPIPQYHEVVMEAREIAPEEGRDEEGYRYRSEHYSRADRSGGHVVNYRSYRKGQG